LGSDLLVPLPRHPNRETSACLVGTGVIVLVFMLRCGFGIGGETQQSARELNATGAVSRIRILAAFSGRAAFSV
jgi:hypothetical protein